MTPEEYAALRKKLIQKSSLELFRIIHPKKDQATVEEYDHFVKGQEKAQ